MNQWIFKIFKSSGALNVEQHKKIKAAGSRPGVLYGLCKVHKNIVDRCPLDPFFQLLECHCIKLQNFWFPEWILLNLMNSPS